MRPGFSVTIAVFVPGTNANAQGLSKVATGDVTNEVPELLVGWAVVELELPQAASSRRKPSQYLWTTLRKFASCCRRNRH